MNRRIKISRLAQADLDRIWEFIAKNRGIDSATRNVDLIAGRFEMLAKYPQSGRSREEIGHGVRSFPAGPYLVYYRLRRSGVEISRVIHSRRHQIRAFNEGS
jgi:toxin ParE1/3/4